MENLSKKLKEILESEADILIVNPSSLTETPIDKTKIKKKVVDHRFEHAEQAIESSNDKNDATLIRDLSSYMNSLYDRKIDPLNVTLTSASPEILRVDSTSILDSSDNISLARANKELSMQLFNYICSVLEKNKDIVLDIETLKNLLDRKPKLFTLTVQESYIFGTFDFARLARIINSNGTIGKANISLNEVYQLLIDTRQIDNEEVFGTIVKPGEFKANHQKIDEFLANCKAKAFVDITQIIVNHLDENYDRMRFIKQQNKRKYREQVTVYMLQSHCTDADIALIHELLNDKTIKIDYDYDYADFFGDSDLKSLIALSENRIIINNLLKHERNIQKYYRYGDLVIQLYMLYAIVGDYEKALSTFLRDYNYGFDYTEDFNDDFNRNGYTYGYFNYSDSLMEFIRKLIVSFTINNTDYPTIKDLINKILKSQNVKYINLEETLAILQGVLSENDLNDLLKYLLESHNAGTLGFITATTCENPEYEGHKYLIRVINETETQKVISTLNNKGKTIEFGKLDENPGLVNHD